MIARPCDIIYSVAIKIKTYCIKIRFLLCNYLVHSFKWTINLSYVCMPHIESDAVKLYSFCSFILLTLKIIRNCMNEKFKIKFYEWVYSYSRIVLISEYIIFILILCILLMVLSAKLTHYHLKALRGCNSGQ